LNGYLLDSHVLLWLLSGSRPIRETARAAIRLNDQRVFMSTAGIAELCIKNNLGKLALPEEILRNPAEGFQAVLEENYILPLPVGLAHATRLQHLPRHHGDPFDRLMIAQAMVDGLTLVTHDRAFARYDGLSVLWA
jgi:PIN domain nuclease of toxin-antitoxin system